MKNEKKLFGTLNDGKEIYSYTVTAENGASATFMTLGATLDSLFIPDKNGKPINIICGYDTPQEYIDAKEYQGAVAGRYANRISGAKFTLNGKEYTLPKNDGNNSLHGGINGISYVVWEEKEYGDNYVTFSYHSPDGEEGYPGNLDIEVKYTFDGENLTVNYSAVSDADTIFNPTNHTYFNLGGYDSGDIKDHTVQVSADFVTETNEELIPTGNFIYVGGTKFDLRKPVKLEEYFDDNFILRRADEKCFAACVRNDNTGIIMEVYTDRPGMQLYTANMMTGKINFKGGVPQVPHCAFCMETQFYPDTPNRHEFPSCVLKAGRTFNSCTRYAFKTEKKENS